MRTLPELAFDALCAQSACNPLGLTKGFAEAIRALAERLRAEGQPHDTDTILRHPIFRLWASKLHDMAGLGLSDSDRYSEAYQACQDLAQNYFPLRPVR